MRAWREAFGLWAVVLILIAGAAIVVSAAQAGVRFEVVIPEDVPTYTGRVYVAIAEPHRPNAGRRAGSPSPRSRMHSWFNPPPVFAVDVVDAKAGDVVVIEEGCLAHPYGPGSLAEGPWLAEAVLRLNPDSSKAGYGRGDRHSPVVPFRVSPGEADSEITVVQLSPTEVVEPRTLAETDRVKLVEFRSKLLSDFHQREVIVRAGVLLPEGFDPDGQERYPVLIDVPGFGGDHFSVQRGQSMMRNLGLETVIYVVPSPECYRGHSVFADSANNGPWGAMLIEEMIPAIEQRFRGAGAQHRYVTGVSSGGWSSLWLQVKYPQMFAGCWSFVPDPVDFRDFQRINLYQPGTNMFVDESGEPRPLARDGQRIMLLYRDFVAREEVLGPGGQIHSFEAVFSPKLEDNTPALVFDRNTGEVNTKVAELWKPYDIRLQLAEHWQELAPALAGKARVYAGSMDTFYLEGAAALLKEWVDETQADMFVEVVEGLRHAPAPHGMRDMAATINARWEQRNAE